MARQMTISKIVLSNKNVLVVCRDELEGTFKISTAMNQEVFVLLKLIKLSGLVSANILSLFLSFN